MRMSAVSVSSGNPSGRPSRRAGWAGLVLSVGLAGLVTVPVAVVAAPAAVAAGETPTTLAVGAPAVAGGSTTTVTATLTGPDGAPLAGQPVLVERSYAGAWRALGAGPVTTGADGTARVPLTVGKDADNNLVRATYAGDPTYAASSDSARVAINKRTGAAGVDGPSSVRDEQSVTLTVTSQAVGGEPVAGRFTLYAKAHGRWSVERVSRTGADGTKRISVKPRSDTSYKVITQGQDWVRSDASTNHLVRNLPYATPWTAPADAPRPTVSVPTAPRAVGAGPNPVVTTIPDAIWSEMTGVSWRSGCPVGRSGLRLVRINYLGFDGYRKRGEVVAARGAVSNIVGALSDMYWAKLPIRSMVRVEKFGYSSELRGANDRRSMAADNTSAFNCRKVVGRSNLSPHARGYSLDVNPWENPFLSSGGYVPNSWWPSRRDARVAWRDRSHAVVRIMNANGLRWTYGRSDLHHFDATGSRSGRVAADLSRAPFRSCAEVCD